MKGKGTTAIKFIATGLALLPIIISGQTMDPVLMPRFTFLAIVLVIVSPFLFSDKSNETPALAFLRSKQVFPFYLFFLTGIIAAFGAINGVEAVYFLVKDGLLFFLMLAIIHFLSGDEKRLYLLLKGILVGAIVISGFGVVQLVQVLSQSAEAADLYLIKSNMAHRNLLASSLVMALPFVGFGAWYFKKFWKWLALSGLVFSGVLIGLLQSRTSWLAALAFLGFFVVILLISATSVRKLKLPLKTLIIATVVFTLGSFVVFYTAVPEEAANAELRKGLDFENPTEKDFTADERLFMWKATGRMINDQGLAGVGPGNWKIWFPKYGSDIWRSRQGMVQFQRPHNDYLWILAEQGIIGLLAYLFMGFSALYCGFRILNQRFYSQPVRLLVSLILSGILAYSVISFFSFPRERIIHQVLLYSSFAIIFSFYFQQKRVGKVKPLRGMKLLMAVMFIFSAFAAYVGYQRSLGEIRTTKMASARVSSQFTTMLAEAEEVGDYHFYNMDPTSLPTTFYSGLALINLKDYERAKTELAKAYTIHPHNIHVVNNLASVYQLSGDLPTAINYYQKALEISPKYVEGALNLAAAYFNNNQVEEAYQTLKSHHKVFSFEGNGDERYKQYMLVVMATARDNLIDAAQTETDKPQLLKLNEEELWNIHLKHLEDRRTLTALILESLTE